LIVQQKAPVPEHVPVSRVIYSLLTVGTGSIRTDNAPSIRFFMNYLLKKNTQHELICWLKMILAG